MLVPQRISSLVRRLIDRPLGPSGEPIYDRILGEIDWESFERIKARYTESGEGLSPKAKYFDFKTFLSHEIRRARMLDLHTLAPRRILDIGCGFGYFGLVCRHLGHSVMGLDLPRSAHDPETRPSTADLYDDACEMFEIPRTLLQIRRLEPLPDLEGAPFQVVSANHVCFNGHGSGTLWGAREWAYFLDDLGRQLAPGARVLIGLNGQAETGRFMSEELLAFFEQRGARVDGNTIDLGHSPA